MNEATALSQFVSGELEFGDLREALSASTQFNLDPKGGLEEVRHIRPLSRVRFTHQDIDRMLDRYERGAIGLAGLAVWGTVLSHLDAFEVASTSDADEEVAWEVLNQLSVAAVNDAFDARRVAELRARLKAPEQEG